MFRVFQFRSDKIDFAGYIGLMCLIGNHGFSKEEHGGRYPNFVSRVSKFFDILFQVNSIIGDEFLEKNATTYRS